MTIKKLKSSEEEILPTCKLVQSLRNGDYDYLRAIGDLVDNSIDSYNKLALSKLPLDKRNILIDIEYNGNMNKSRPHTVNIIDGAKGMKKETLKLAMAYGSMLDHKDNDIGHFGLGMKTAATSMGKVLTVLTKHVDGKLVKGVLDLDRVKETQSWVYDFAEPTPKDELWFKFKLTQAGCGTDHGTIVSITKLDNLTVTAKAIISRLSSIENLPRIFSKTLDNCNIYVGENLIKPKSYDNGVFVNETISESFPKGWRPLESKSERTKGWFFRVISGGLGGESRKQGIDVFVSGRSMIEWRQLSTYGVWKPVWQTSGVVVELKYEGKSSDVYTGNDVLLTFSKSQVRFSQSFTDILRKNINPFTNQIINRKDKVKQLGHQNKSDIDHKLADVQKTIKTSEISISEELNEEYLEKHKVEFNTKNSHHNDKEDVIDINKAKQQRYDASRKMDEFAWEQINAGRHGRAWEKPSFSYRGKKRIVCVKINIDHPWINSRMSSLHNDTFLTTLELITAMSVQELESSNGTEFDEMVASLSSTLTNVMKATENVEFTKSNKSEAV